MTENKKKSRQFSRSLFIVKDVKAGEELSIENVRSIRPRSSPRVRHRGEKRESAIRFRRER